jgi:hypothetical protein
MIAQEEHKHVTWLPRFDCGQWEALVLCHALVQEVLDAAADESSPALYRPLAHTKESLVFSKGSLIRRPRVPRSLLYLRAFRRR